MHFIESWLAFGVNHLETKYKGTFFYCFMMGVSILETGMQPNLFFIPFGS